MTISTGGPSRDRLRLRESLPLAAILFVLWIILSGKLDLFHLGIGALAALVIAYATCPLYQLDPPVGPRGRHPFYTLPWARLFAYAPWLGWQIALAAFQVARIVLQRDMNLRPRLFRFDHPLPHNFARATLANSITLTPGTVTIDVRADEYLVHALNDEAASGLETQEPGNMKQRVDSLFERDA